METLKKPETIITLTNTAALLGASVYFYRRINGLEQDLDKYSEHLTTTIKKVREIQVIKQHVGQLAQAIRELNNTAGAQRNELTYLRNLSGFQREQIKELQGQAEKLGADCKLTQVPFQQQNRYNQHTPQGLNQSYTQVNQPMNQGYSQQTPQPMNQGYSQQTPQPMNQGYSQQTPQPMNQGYSQQTPQPMNQGYSQQTNQPMNQGYHQPMTDRQNRQNNQGVFGQQVLNPTQTQNSNQGYNQNVNQGGLSSLIDLDLGGMNQPMNQGMNQPMNQGMNQPMNQGMNQPMNQGFDGLGYQQEMGNDDDLDSQINAVRRARSQHTSEVNSLGI
jgi:hypothetical protein